MGELVGLTEIAYRVRMDDHEKTGAAAAADLSLELVSDRCNGGTCPAIYRTNRGTFVVQGASITAEAAGIDLGPGESLVEVPAALLPWSDAQP